MNLADQWLALLVQDTVIMSVCIVSFVFLQDNNTTIANTQTTLYDMMCEIIWPMSLCILMAGHHICTENGHHICTVYPGEGTQLPRFTRLCETLLGGGHGSGQGLYLVLLEDRRTDVECSIIHLLIKDHGQPGQRRVGNASRLLCHLKSTP